MKTPRMILGLAVLVAASAGCQKKGPAAPPPAMPPPEVVTLAVAPRSVLLTTELPGRVTPCRVAEIRPQVNGLIRKRLFTEGADVQAGQELYQIDPAPFQTALDTAKAALARSQAVLPAHKARADRLRNALADKAVSQQDYEEADAALKQAEADIQYWAAMVETAHINLEYAHIISPISGRIGKSAVTDGAIVTAYQPQPLAVIQQLDPIYVDVPQSASELLRLQRRLEDGKLAREESGGNAVTLILDDNRPYAQEGALQFRDVSVDPTTGSVILRMVFPNPDARLLPGLFVRAVVKEGLNDKAILIPQQSVTRTPKGEPMALIVNGQGVVEPRKLELDRALGDQWLVSAGLAPGDRVVVEGMQKIRPGMAVKEAPSAAAPGPASATK